MLGLGLLRHDKPKIRTNTTTRDQTKTRTPKTRHKKQNRHDKKHKDDTRDLIGLGLGFMDQLETRDLIGTNGSIMLQTKRHRGVGLFVRIVEVELLQTTHEGLGVRG